MPWSTALSEVRFLLSLVERCGKPIGVRKAIIATNEDKGLLIDCVNTLNDDCFFPFLHIKLLKWHSYMGHEAYSDDGVRTLYTRSVGSTD